MLYMRRGMTVKTTKIEDIEPEQFVVYDALIPSNVGKGWKELVDPLVVLCEEAGGQVEQVKEKFGGLRFYYSSPVEENEDYWNAFEKLVQATESMSYFVCERTGKPGKLRSRKDGKPAWMKTLSDEEAEKQGYDL